MFSTHKSDTHFTEFYPLQRSPLITVKKTIVSIIHAMTNNKNDGY